MLVWGRVFYSGEKLPSPRAVLDPDPARNKLPQPPGRRIKHGHEALNLNQAPNPEPRGFQFVLYSYINLTSLKNSALMPERPGSSPTGEAWKRDGGGRDCVGH